LADDHGIVRQGLRGLLDEQTDIEVVAEAKDGREALDLVREVQPDVVVMDITMPNLNGMDATCQIVRQFPQVKVVALSAHSGRSYAAGMLEAGASGYVLKECLFDELIKAIRTVVTGRRYLSTRIAGDIAADQVTRSSDSTPLSSGSLTEREMQMLRLLTEGKSVKEIASQLKVSPKTADANRRKMMNKIGISSAAGLVKYAVREGIISLEV
jgi:DNA-binding NarL/FixJ family response regulator